jgi:hypothetical protein
MRRPKKDIRKTAWHEAGHAVHALEIGMPFEGVWVKLDSDEATPSGLAERMNAGDKPMGAVLRSPGDIYNVSDYDLIANCMAGLAGERIMRGTKRAGMFTLLAYLSGCAMDWEAAKSYAEQHNADGRSKFNIDINRYIHIALERAWMLLKECSRAHKAVADALIERGYLSHEECLRIAKEVAWR